MPTPLVLLALLAASGQAAPATAPPEPAPAPRDDFRPEPGWRPLGPSLWFDPEGRCLVLRAQICLRRGALEHLLCRRNTKEHESILTSDAPPRQIHAGLLLTGAEPGHPVRYKPDFQPPAGTPIEVQLRWDQGGEQRVTDARTWVKDIQDNKTLERTWVFAGSELFKDPDSGKVIYGADDGDVITVANFTTALLDLPIASSAEDAARSFEANTPAIPPEGTPVTVILRPMSRPPAARPR